MGPGDLLASSSFALTRGTAETGLASVWGRGAVTRFDGRDGALGVDGEVSSAMLGADFSRDAAAGRADALALARRGWLPR